MKRPSGSQALHASDRLSDAVLGRRRANIREMRRRHGQASDLDDFVVRWLSHPKPRQRERQSNRAVEREQIGKKNIRAVFKRQLNKEAIGDLIAVDRVTRPARLDKASVSRNGQSRALRSRNRARS